MLPTRSLRSRAAVAWLAAAFTVLAGLTACGGDKQPPTGPDDSQPGQPAFSLALSPATLTVAQGTTGTADVKVSRSGGFGGPVTLDASDIPAGVTLKAGSNPVAADNTALYVEVAANAAPGSYTLKLIGQVQGMPDRTTPLSLTITAGKPSGYRGTLTLAREGGGSVLDPEQIVDLDVATGAVTVRFDGIEPHRTATGETAFLARLAAGSVGDRGVVVADARGATGTPLYVCKDFSLSINHICHTPKLSPNKQLVAFGANAAGGSVCKDSYGIYYASYVMVRDRSGAEVARFEGYAYPEWLPDGRLLVMGTACRGAGVWVADAALKTLTRVDGNQVGTPASFPAVRPDGSRVAFLWNKQVWALTLGGARAELEQLVQSSFEIASVAWSPDGSALAVLWWDVSLPITALGLVRPGDDNSVVVLKLPFHPYGPLSWH